MSRLRWVGAAAVVAAAVFSSAGSSCSSPETKREICGNGLDDDGNGLADCLDPDCAGQAACVVDPGDYGPCKNCGHLCSAQASCFEQKAVLERPPPLCNAGHCEALNFPIQVNFNLDLTAYNGISITDGTVSFRWVLKKAIDGSAVTCAVLDQVVTAAADGGRPTNSAAVDQDGRFNLLGIDVFPLHKQPMLPVNLVSTATGSDYLIWLETWTGGRDSTTSLPTGLLIGTGCIDSGPGVAPLTANDNCDMALFPDGGNPGCRTISYAMPAPK